jgi:Domain of unknown function (DUF4286)
MTTNERPTHDVSAQPRPSTDARPVDGDADADRSSGQADARPVTYEAELTCEPHLASALEAYMRGRHIPDILATGCFRSIRFERAGPTRFRAAYTAATRADLDRYLTDHTAPLRADFLAHFPTGVTVARAEWEMVQCWEASSPEPEARGSDTSA